MKLACQGYLLEPLTLREASKLRWVSSLLVLGLRGLRQAATDQQGWENPSVVSTSLIADYLYLSFFSLNWLVAFTLSHFNKFSPTLLQVLQPLVSVVLNV